MSVNAFIFNILLAIPASALVCFTVVPEWLRRWESRLGDLSYGIYLNHFAVAAILLWIAEAHGSEVFGRFNKPEFGLWAALACVLMAAATFNLIERPIENLRRKIKGASRVEALPSLAPSPTAVTPA
jgi:peptidoglycan/LPS O-acetylase OafA/YrhL